MGIRIMVNNGQFFIQNSTTEQFSALMHCGGFKYDSYIDRQTGKKEKAVIGLANLDNATKLKEVLRKDGLRLPPDADALWKQLHAVHEAVDRERKKEKPTPLFKYPVKMPLYEHQQRAANMCLLTFGWVAPEAEVRA